MIDKSYKTIVLASSFLITEVIGAVVVLLSWSGTEKLENALTIQLLGPFLGLWRVLKTPAQDEFYIMFIVLLINFLLIFIPAAHYLKYGKLKVLVAACLIWFLWGSMNLANDRF